METPAAHEDQKQTTKWILRQILHKYVPPELLERPKTGFGIPIDRWLRVELRDWAESLLSTKSLCEHGLLNVDAIRDKWREHTSGARNWQYLIWNVLMLQAWQENWKSSGPQPAAEWKTSPAVVPTAF